MIGATKENEALKKAALGGVEVLIKNELDQELIAKLQWCIGSYESDLNPVGVYEFSKETFDKLTKYKSKNPKKVTKKVLDSLEKSLKAVEKTL